VTSLRPILKPKILKSVPHATPQRKPGKAYNRNFKLQDYLRISKDFSL
jgi:hypothetical protein